MKLDIGGAALQLLIYAMTTGWRCRKPYICHLFMVCVHTRTEGIIHKPQNRFTK